jgi:hypothetical protein
MADTATSFSKARLNVIPAEAGIQVFNAALCSGSLDPGFIRVDDHAYGVADRILLKSTAVTPWTLSPAQVNAYAPS